jgi:small nuclear ribonucleoprotein E
MTTLLNGQKGFDEFMNLVLDDAAEVHVKKNTKKDVGKILYLINCAVLTYLSWL